MKILLSYAQILVLYAGLLLLGQGLVYVACFGRHETNPVYRFFRFLTSPLVKAVRPITPKKVAERHLPVVAFFVLFWLFFAIAVLLPKL